ncbi:MAG TPA: hypothetical protein QF624_02645 [Dehalococcoidia bacterium]|nr:hypothetical protein [Dehalococcoidia bacterium]
MTLSVNTYYNALLAAGRVRELSIAEARRDLVEIERSVSPPLYQF